MDRNSVQTVITHSSPLVSVIIPSFDGHRDGNVPKLVEQIRTTRFESLELLIVKGVRPNGRARDEGVQKARGQYFIFLDDDVQIGSDNFVTSLIEPLQSPNARIGVTGAAYLLPPHSSDFQKKVAAQIPRVECAPVQTLIESDMVCHACLAVSAKVYKEVGGESRILVSGTDPDFKARIRQHGYTVALSPNTWVYMATYENLPTLCWKAFATGKNSALTQRAFADRVFASGETTTEKVPAERSFSQRIAFSVRKTLESICKGHWLYVLNRLCYAVGYGVGRLTGFAATSLGSRNRRR